MIMSYDRKKYMKKILLFLLDILPVITVIWFLFPDYLPLGYLVRNILMIMGIIWMCILVGIAKAKIKEKYKLLT